VKQTYSFVDFSEIADDDDVLWKADHRETLEEIATRALAFASWLGARPEDRIFVVSHSAFMSALLNVALDCDACTEISDYFQPGEIRKVRIEFPS
jgi:broad specificity phosphatase PhoE